MNILLITNLYPNAKDESVLDAPYAIHYFAKKWIELGSNVKVIRISPKYPRLFNIFRKGQKAYSLKQGETFNLEGVEVLRICIRKIPKLDYLRIDKTKTSNLIFDTINKDFKAHVILCHMTNPSLEIASNLKNAMNIPIVATLHNTDVINFQNSKKILNDYKRLRSEIDLLGFRSNKIKTMYQQSLGIKDPLLDRSFIISSGIDKNVIIQEEILIYKRKKRIKTIFIAAKMISLKNIDILIKAFCEIPQELNLNLIIAGDGPERVKLEKLAKRSRKADNIEFLGFLERDMVMHKMEESDIFAMVSAPETLGLVYLEAMAKGCIVIGSRGEGIDGVIQNGKNGYLCTPRKVQELACTIRKVINLPIEEKSRIIDNAVITAKNMTQEIISNEYINILKAVINENAGGVK